MPKIIRMEKMPKNSVARRLIDYNCMVLRCEGGEWIYIYGKDCSYIKLRSGPMYNENVELITSNE